MVSQFVQTFTLVDTFGADAAGALVLMGIGKIKSQH
jgi:hypothetical protein